MYTEYSFRGKKYQFNTEASLKMGKEAFIAQYKGNVPNVNIIWDMIAGSEVEKPKSSKK